MLWQNMMQSMSETSSKEIEVSCVAVCGTMDSCPGSSAAMQATVMFPRVKKCCFLSTLSLLSQHKWRCQVLAKNAEIEQYREELDSLLAAFRVLQQGRTPPGVK